MPTTQRLFRLIVDDLTGHGRFSLRLTDGQGRSLSTHQVNADPNDACWRGLFEMDVYLEAQRGRFGFEQQQNGQADRALLAELGDFLRAQVLGPQIAGVLFASAQPGIIFVELPAERRPEVLELTRIPWELARSERGQTLPEASLAVQLVPRGLMPGDVSLDQALAEARPFEPGGPLRILLAFAQSRGQVALAMREMRERLRQFFLEKVAPRYQIELDILQYGVTQGTLEHAARRGGGYHIVHLFAHGHEDLLVLEDDEGQDDEVSGEKIAGLLSGDFAAAPQLVFLTACHSGEIKLKREIADVWQAVRQVQAQTKPDAPVTLEAPEPAAAALAAYTGTALAMLRAGVPQVVAMRYTVEERFAFDLAEEFYRYVLLDGMPPALALGRFRAKARKADALPPYRPHD